VQTQTRYARSGDVAIAYQVIGDGPFDVVFVPGSSSHVELNWEVPALRRLNERLARFCRLIVFDKRGTGMSDRVQGAPPLEVRMDDVRAVMDAAGSGRAALIGVSEGVAMAVLFAATYPERTGALCLYGGAARELWAPDYPWGTPEAEYLRLVAEDRARVMEPGAMAEMAASGSPRAGADELTALERYFRNSTSPGAEEALAMMNMQIDIRSVLPTIAVPTLVLHFARDPWVEVGQGRYLAERIPGATYVELDGDCHVPSLHEVDAVADEYERFLCTAWTADGWADAEADRVLATILFTDIVDSTMQLARLGDAGWAAVLRDHHALVRRQLARHRGRELDTAGDGFFASFDGPARGIRCATAISRTVADLGIQVRAGLHTGECQLVDGKPGGIAVHVGARIAAHAGAGEVLVSSTVRDLVSGSGIAFVDRGVRELKGVPGEWRLFGVS
jgi:pimeloyl-ACP methyl ester carboxylesterase/class 3 adenylate cyclase